MGKLTRGAVVASGILKREVVRASVLGQLAIAIFAAIAGLSAAAGAQDIRVHVIDRDSRAPVVGAIVVLQNETGARVASALTDELGNTVLRATSAGPDSRIRVQRVGYAPSTSSTPPLAMDRVIEIEIEIRPQLLQLDAVAVTRERSRCDVNPAEGSVAAAVWAQVQNALTANILTDADLLPVSTWQYTRTLDRVLRVIGETPPVRSSASNARFVAADPELLSHEGFVHPVNGVMSYFAPDAALLLSDAFARDHCFGVATTPAASDFVGLSFQPVSGRDLPDVAGVLWVDRQTSELRWMDFHFTHLPAPAETGQASGRLDFTSLPNGEWLTQEWYLRVPRLAHIGAQRLGNMSVEPHDTLIGYHEQGGWLTLSTPTDRSPRGIAALTGTVFDSIRGRPLAGVRVALGGNAEATTDSAGRYHLQSPLAGRYTVRFSHPRLQLFGDSLLEHEAVLSLGATASLDAATPSAATARARLCPANGAGGARGMVVVQVVDSSSSDPVRGARMQISWRATHAAREGSMVGSAAADSVLELETNATGGAVVCALPLDEPLRVRAEQDGRRAERTPIRVDSIAMTEVTIALGASRTRAATIRGRVVTGTGADRHSLSSAEVLVPALGRATRTNAKGEFTLSGLADASYALVVRSIGYTPAIRRISTGAVRDSAITVVLEPQATELQRVLVSATAPEMGKMRGFEERRSTNGGGHFITRQDLEKREQSPLEDVLRSIGVGRMVTQRDGSIWPASQRGETAVKKRTCYYQLILDGVRMVGRPDPVDDPPADLRDFAPRGIEAVEVYFGPGATPIQWGGIGATCGTIVIWTRQ